MQYFSKITLNLIIIQGGHMKISTKFFITILLLFMMSTALFFASAIEVNSRSAILVDTKTNTVIYQKNINDSIYPGGLTKLMTAIVVYENCSLNDTVVITQEDVNKMKSYQNYVTFKAGETLTVEDLLYCMVLDSSNLAAYVLAQHVAGTEEQFVSMMNAKALELGAENTNFVNATGIDDIRQYSTVWDMYIVSEYITRNADLMSIMSAQRYTLSANEFRAKDTLFYTNNHLLSKFKNLSYYYRYANGLISGYTKQAGYVISASANKGKNSMQLIFIGAGSQSDEASKVLPAFDDAKKIFEDTFSNYEINTIIEQNKHVGEASISLSLETDYVPLVTAQEVSVVLPKETNEDDFETKTTIKENIKAPIKQGDILGTYEVYYKNQLYASSPITTNSNVEGSIFLIFIDFVVSFFENPLTRFLFILAVVLIAGYIIFTIRVNRRRNMFRKKNNKRYRGR